MNESGGGLQRDSDWTGLMQCLQSLADAGQLVQAAELAEQAGLYEQATTWFERSCEFSRAAQSALLMSDAARALSLAILANDQPTIATCIDKLAKQAQRARGVAEAVRGRGHAAVSARLLERVGDLEQAAAAYEQAGQALHAARVYEQLGNVLAAGRVLEAAHRRDDRDMDVALQLGLMLCRYGKHAHAARVLQRIPLEVPQYDAALPALAQCYEALGMTDALRQLRSYAARRGLSLEPQPLSNERSASSLVYSRYQPLRLVASTPSARVTEALDKLTGHKVAIKQLLPSNLVGAGRDAVERLAREASALSRLQHPNVVPLVELVGQGSAVVTQWMDGGSLATRLAQGPLEPARAIEIAAGVLTALAEAHRLGIVHRDVKPSNILFDAAGVPRLADFGAAHLADTAATATAGVIGTLAYMSPEQREGRPATPASDVFSVGVVLWDMLTGTMPPAPIALGSFHPELGTAHDHALQSLLAQEPSSRPPSALSARDRLLELSWPNRLAPKSELPQQPSAAPQARVAQRKRMLAHGGCEDTWLNRPLLITELTDQMRTIARAYAKANSPYLSTVLRLDEQAGEIWFEHAESPCLDDLPQARLSPRQADCIREALQALHAEGVTHGCVDARHVYLKAGEPLLAFEPATASFGIAEQDLAALDALTHERR